MLLTLPALSACDGILTALFLHTTLPAVHRMASNPMMGDYALALESNVDNSWAGDASR